MSVYQRDLDIFAGSDFEHSANLSSIYVEIADSMDYSGFGRLQLVSDESEIADFDVSLAEDTMVISMSATNTALLTPGDYNYLIDIVHSDSGKRTTILHGVVTVHPDI